MKRPISIVLAATALAFGISACSQVEVLNKGGETPCNEFIAQSADEQRVTVTKFLKEQRNGEDPTDANVDSGIGAIDILCRVQQNAETPIKNADLTGIFVEKPSE